MILVMLAGLAFVFPLAVYCLILASLNRRSHPVMVAGPWDFSEVLFACSGFLLFGGPMILTGFNQRWRDYWIYGRSRALAAMGADWYFWIAVWACYFVIVIAGSAYLLWRRRLVTAIYNIDAPVLEEYLGLVLDRLRLDWVRVENRFVIGSRLEDEPAEPSYEAAAGTYATADVSPASTLGLAHRRLGLTVDAFPAMRHVTLHWPADAGPVRDEVETELARALAEVRTRNNPVSFWMTTVAGMLFLFMSGVLIFLVLTALALARG